MIMRFLICIGILMSTTTFASSLKKELTTINSATLATEIQALNCLMSAQKEKKIVKDCRKAEFSIHIIDKQIATLIDKLTLDSNVSGSTYYGAMDQVKQFRLRLQKIRSNLFLTKKTMGIYDWNNKISSTEDKKN